MLSSRCLLYIINTLYRCLLYLLYIHEQNREQNGQKYLTLWKLHSNGSRQLKHKNRNKLYRMVEDDKCYGKKQSKQGGYGVRIQMFRSGKSSLKWHLKQKRRIEDSEAWTMPLCGLKFSQAEEMADTKGLKQRCTWYVQEKNWEASMDWVVSKREWWKMVPESQCSQSWTACGNCDGLVFTLHAMKKH